MPKLTGVIKGINGKLNDFVFYELDGKAILRRAGKVSKERYAHAPEFEELRQNQSEFGLASQLSKTVRQSLSAVLKQQTGGRCSGRLTGAFRKILQAGKGNKGQKGLEASHLRMLDGFPLDKHKPRAACMISGIHLQLDHSRQVIEVNCIHLTCPEEEHATTHFVVGVVMLSEIVFDQGYQGIQPEWHGMNFFVNVSAKELASREGASKISFTIKDTIPEGVGVIGVAGRVF